MSKAYLIGYNFASAFGWGIILTKVIQSGLNGDSGKALWKEVGTPLLYVQSCAFLEVLHALFGLVRSPVGPTFLQVMSRLILVWVYMLPDGSNGHWGLYLCIGSWALVEVPRYLYYVNALLVKGSHKINSILFWLRYTLFMILYPTGITGEIVLMYNTWNLLTTNKINTSTSFGMRMIAFNLFMYIPLAPFMIMNMYGNRKRSFKKRKQLMNPRPLSGLIWPITNANKNERSTTKTNKLIWAESIKNIDDNEYNRVNKEKNWRFKYNKYVLKNVQLSCKSKGDALKIAEQGLNKAYQVFEFKRDNKVIPLEIAMRKGQYNGTFETHIIKGDKSVVKELSIPYVGGKFQGKPYYLGKKDNTVLTGLKIPEQLNKWVKYGTIEPSAGEAIMTVYTNRDKYLDLSNKYFVLLGATSAMGPLYFLLKYGANVIAIDLDRDFIWKKLFKAVRDSPGTLIFPVKKEIKTQITDDDLAKISGCDLLNDTPEIANWLSQVCPGKQLNIGNYTYLDGALHVQLSLACDSIIKRLCDERKDTSISFLCTPTDDHVITKEAYKAAEQNYKYNVPTWISIFNLLFCGKILGKPNYKSMINIDDKLYIIDGIVVAQGPNYGLAKRIQHWRAVIQHNKGHIVSSNVAPSTATKSVVHNAQFAAAYGGMHHFKPMEVMYQETSLAVMGSLLLNDLINKECISNPNSNAAKNMVNPYQLFSYNSFHGGVWRCAYKINDIGIPSALSYYWTQNKLLFILGITSSFLGITWLGTGKMFIMS